MALSSNKMAVLVSAVALTAAAAAGCDDAVITAEAPADDPAKIHDFLARGGYTDWETSGRFSGLNGTGVVVFLNEEARYAGSRPGAVGVRELYASPEPTAEFVGWSLILKTGDGEQADDWYFYETFAPEDPRTFAVAEHAALECVGCHQSAPDVVQSARPL